MTSSYLTEKVNYGGEIVTRGEMITDLNRVATTWTDDLTRQRQLVDRYMQGAELYSCGCDATESCSECV